MGEVIMTKEKALENEEFRKLYETPTDCAGKVFNAEDIDCVGSDEEDPCRFLEECRAVCVADSTVPVEEDSEELEESESEKEVEESETEESDSFGVPQMIHLVEKAAEVIHWNPAIKETAVRVNVYFEEADQDLVICQPGAVKLLVPYQWKNDGKSVKQWMEVFSLDCIDAAEVCHGGVKVSLEDISEDLEDTLLGYIYEHLSSVDIFLDEYYSVHPSNEDVEEAEEEEETPDAVETTNTNLTVEQMVHCLRVMQDSLETLAEGFGGLAEVMDEVVNTTGIVEDND